MGTRTHIFLLIWVIVVGGVLYRARRGVRIHATRFVFVNTFDSYIDELLSNSFIYTLDSRFVF